MKKLIPSVVALLILILCSCNAKKSFLTQRYTHLKHQKASIVTEDRSLAHKGTKAAVITPEITVASTKPAQVKAAENPEAKQTKLVYTKSVINGVIVPVALKGKEKVTGLLSSNSKQPTSKVEKIKPLKFEQTQQKRGLLWGVIDGILAIIVLAVFVLLVVWLVLVLT
jgi:hypothetical protein